MAGVPLGTTTQLQITIPKKGEVNWAESIKQNCFQKIVEHDHSGNGKGAKINIFDLDNLEIDTQDMVDGDVLQWDAFQGKFVAGEVNIDITDGTVDTTKTAFQIYNVTTTSQFGDLPDSIQDESLLTASTELDNVNKIDTRQDAFNIDTGRYTVQRGGTFDLSARILLNKIACHTKVTLAIRKLSSINLFETIYTKTVNFNNLEPIGTIKAFAHNVSPNASGEDYWLECNGDTVNASTHPVLRRVLFSKTNTHIIPDLNNDTYSFLRGAGDSEVGRQDEDTTAKNGLIVNDATGTIDSSDFDANHRHIFPELQESAYNCANEFYADVWDNPVDEETSGPINTDNTQTKDLDHSHTIDKQSIIDVINDNLAGDAETAPKSTRVKYWIKAKHPPQAIELSILDNLNIGDQVFVTAYHDSEAGFPTPTLDLTTKEGFFFKGYRLL